VPIERFWVHDLTIVRPSTIEGRYGTEVDWTSATRRTVKGWVSARQPADLALANRDESAHRDIDVSYWEGFVPAGTDIDPQDRVEAFGYEFEIIGHPRPAFAPDRTNHIEFLLKVVEG
jgi:hypothetical protein